jgi:fused signal recognition particle receptor
MSADKESAAPRQGFIKRLRARLNRGDSWLTYDLANLAPGGQIDEDVLDELESLLVMADVGIDTTERIIGDLQKSLARRELKDIDALRAALRSALVSIPSWRDAFRNRGCP